MFSPKVVFAVVLIVIIIALLLINFEGLADKVKGTFKGGSKLNVGFGASGKPGGTLNLSVFPTGEFVLRPESPVDITVESTTFSGFLGEIRVDYVNRTLKFIDSRTPLKVEFKLSKVELGKGLALNKLSLQNTRMRVEKDGWIKNIDNGTIEVDGFVGFGTITTESVELTGNVTKFAEKY